MTQTTQFETDMAANHTSKKRSADSPIVVQFQNGPPTGGPRSPKRVQWIHLAEDGDYVDHQVLARIRYPDSINTEFSSGDFARIRGGLQQLVLEHNGWLDPDSGQVLPPAKQACLRLAEIDRYTKEMKEFAAMSSDTGDKSLDGAKAEKLAAERAKSQATLAEFHRDIMASFDRQEPACCFWDMLAQEEILLLLRAIGGERKKVLASLLETKTD